MTVLGIDTSTAAGGVALLAGDQVLGRLDDSHALLPSRRLLPLILELLERCQLHLQDLTGIAVAAGPGSFTGLRIGLATANGLGFALACPVLGVSSLHAFAEEAAVAASACGGIVSLLDARRGQVFAARFRAQAGGAVRESEDEIVAVDEACGGLVRSGDVVLGDGAMRYQGDLGLPPGAHVLSTIASAAAGVARLGRDALLRGTPLSPALPRYLRRLDVELNPGV